MKKNNFLIWGWWVGLLLGMILILINLFGGEFVFPELSERHIVEILLTSVILLVIPIYSLFILLNNKLNNWLKLVLTVIPISLLLAIKSIIYVTTTLTNDVLISHLIASVLLPLIVTLILTLIPIIIYLIIKKRNVIPILFASEFTLVTLLFSSLTRMDEMFNVGGANAEDYVLVTGYIVLFGSVLLLSILLPFIVRSKK